MKKKQVSVTIVISILNEENSIESLLQGFNQQTVHPEKVIIVDGGSNDSTLELVNSYKKNKNFSLQVLSLIKTNRSQARNIGIQQANTEIIVITDAGCIPKPDWLEKIIQPFFDEPKTEVVAGFYDPSPQNQFEEIVANATSTRSWNFNPSTFLPSSRSVAFTKKIWEKVGGYDEVLAHNEDLPFAEKLKKTAKYWKVVPEAQVIWRQPTSISELMNKLGRYAIGDLESHHERHVKKIQSAVWRMGILVVAGVPLIFMTLSVLRFLGFSLFGLYVIGTWIKHCRAFQNLSYFYYAPLIQVSVDIALFQSWVYFHLQRLSKPAFS